MQISRYRASGDAFALSHTSRRCRSVGMCVSGLFSDSRMESSEWSRSTTLYIIIPIPGRKASFRRSDEQWSSFTPTRGTIPYTTLQQGLSAVRSIYRRLCCFDRFGDRATSFVSL
eukprot:TRINITY_DN34081_c0_g1_i1.p2 TRINITY_DN34081_c0_g1~~TRINITY_DN34081_c0_g1_i1.p2  ORF type:complete len:115 (+),score=4.28 TRINITY_DN34081_c0_g1_i1:591-935(+)